MCIQHGEIEATRIFRVFSITTAQHAPACDEKKWVVSWRAKVQGDSFARHYRVRVLFGFYVCLQQILKNVNQLSVV